MNRRRFLLGALSAPAVITTPGLLMPVKALADDYVLFTNDRTDVFDVHVTTFTGGARRSERLRYQWIDSGTVKLIISEQDGDLRPVTPKADRWRYLASLHPGETILQPGRKSLTPSAASVRVHISDLPPKHQ